MAGKLGMTVSALRKRMLSPGVGFDAVTVRAILLIQQTRTDDTRGTPRETVDAGGYLIDLHDSPEGTNPTWRTK